MTREGLNVPITTLCKLVSVVVHAQEMMSPKGHPWDKVALEQLLADDEIKAFIKELGPLAPVKREGG